MQNEPKFTGKDSETDEERTRRIPTGPIPSAQGTQGASADYTRRVDGDVLADKTVRVGKNFRTDVNAVGGTYRADGTAPGVGADASEPEPQDTKKRGCLRAFVYVAVIVGISLLLSALIITSANEVFALVKEDNEITVTIPEGTTTGELASLLKRKGVIDNTLIMNVYMAVTGVKDEDIEPGDYALNSNMAYNIIFSAIEKKASARETVNVTIPEGLTQDEIFALLEKDGVAKASELAEAAANYDFNYKWVKSLAKGEKRLEGYLFPDTYTFYIGDKPANVIGKFLSNFNNKYDVEFKTRAEELDVTLEEVVIIASMVEKEAKLDEERPTIASVIYNRLGDDDFPNLQIDATVQYALPQHKEKLSSEDIAIDSPYNTYIIEGLPPGAICNPGLAAITAALWPDDTNYYYYVADTAKNDGSHIFSRTKSEHEAAIADIAAREKSGADNADGSEGGD